MARDCPIFAKAKFIWWTWPITLGEDSFIIIFGSLHLEMGMWKMLGHCLASSEWTIALSEDAAGIATAGIADRFLKNFHLTRTCRAHQLTSSVALIILQPKVYQPSKDDRSRSSFEVWREKMIKRSPPFNWDTVLNVEVLVLIIV